VAAMRAATVVLVLCGWMAGGALAQSDSSFKATFGAKTQRHGANWNGGVADASRVRRTTGWHLHDDDRLIGPGRWEILSRSVGGDVAAPGVVLDLTGPEGRAVDLFSRRANVRFTPEDVPYGRVFYPEGAGKNIAIERVPTAVRVSRPEGEDDSPALLRTRSGEYWLAWTSFAMTSRDGPFRKGADRVMVARSLDGSRWSEPRAATPEGDHFRVALGEDGGGRVVLVYALQEELGSGNFDLFARTLEAGDWAKGNWSRAERLTDDPRPDAFHRMAGDVDGNLTLAWAGFRDSPDGGRPQSDILMRRFSGGSWGRERNLTNSPEDDWAPAVAAKDGRAWVAWDSYRADGYDVLLREVGGETREVAATPYAELRADVAVDGEGRVWVAWDEAAPNWGKDTGYANEAQGIFLKEGGARIYERPATGRVRTPRLAVWTGEGFQQPTERPESRAAEYLDQRLFQSPRLTTDGAGRVWVILRHQWRAAGRWGGHLFDLYATTWGEGGWVTPILLPQSTGRQDTVVAGAGGDGQMVFAVTGDGRRLPVALPSETSEVSAVRIDQTRFGEELGEPELEDFRPTAAEDGFRRTHPNEREDLARIRGHRLKAGGEEWKIVRGDLHRHTEISMDGATDGSILDAYRYALNAADLDFLGVSDHNYGQRLDTDQPSDAQSDSEFQWWRTQKLADVFYVPGRFTPLYGYERTVNFPLGHRNIFHARRGVFSLKVPKLHVRESPEVIDEDPPKLWAYLRETGGLGIPHTPGTSMGTDWRRRDDEVVPVVEIYQGDRNAYETEGAPRAASPDSPGLGQAGQAPYQNGLVWNALGVGYRMGFIASSDHYSTHISYANLIVPARTTTRSDLLDAIRARRTYASTDNIVVDFQSEGRLQGALIETEATPAFEIAVEGTGPLLRVEIVKNNRVIYARDGRGERRLAFTYRDAEDEGGDMVGATPTIRDWSRPETGIRARPKGEERYYYVRVVQSYSEAEPEKEGEVAWSSPIFIRRGVR